MLKVFNHFSIPAVICVIILPLSSIAQPSISGSLTGTLGPGTYIVDGDCNVPAGNSLTIAPGTTFLHSGYFIWSVNGSLHAVGSPADSIKFLGRWGGIRFIQGSSPESQLTYCVIDHCSNMGNPYSFGGCIYTQVGITIRNSSITFGNAFDSGGGIYATGADSIIIEDCYVAHCIANKGGGICLNECDGARITNCFVEANYAQET